MATYKKTFAKLDRTALIPFFVIGDPDYNTSLELVKTALDAGADILELGLAFSDPIADGPTIQKADIRARQAGITVKRALEFIKQVTDHKDVPVGLLVYYNLVYQYGVDKFCEDFKTAGGTSILIADLSIDDADEIAAPAENAGLETVFMATPVTSDARMKAVIEKTTGFIYTVSVLGVTGERSSLSDAVKPLVTRLKNMTDLPVCVGFGISSPQLARQVAQAGADGVIIGSRIVKIIESNLDDKDKMLKEVRSFVGDVVKVLGE